MEEEYGLCTQGKTISANWCLLSLWLDRCLLVIHNGLDHWSIQPAHFWQVSIDFHKFHFKGATSILLEAWERLGFYSTSKLCADWCRMIFHKLWNSFCSFITKTCHLALQWYDVDIWHWLKHILFITRHDKRIRQSKKLCLAMFSPLHIWHYCP